MDSQERSSQIVDDNVEESIVLDEHLPPWIVDVYESLSENNTTNYITLSEVLSRSIDPESPRWFMIPVKKQEFGERIRVWSAIRDEIYSHLRKDNKAMDKSKISNASAYHNAAVLSFFLNEYETCFQIMDKLIDSDMNATHLRAICYFYICTSQFENAAAIFMETPDSETQLSIIPIGTLKDFRNDLLNVICTHKPKNRLYALYQQHYDAQVNDAEYTAEEAREQCVVYIKMMLNQKEKNIITKTTKSKFQKIISFLFSLLPSTQFIFKLSAILISVLGFAAVTRNLSFYFAKKKRDQELMFSSIQNSFYNQNKNASSDVPAVGSDDFVLNKKDLEFVYPSNLIKQKLSQIRPPISQPSDPFDDQDVPPVKTDDYEYVNNLYNEIQQISSEQSEPVKKIRKVPKKKNLENQLVTITSGDGIVSQEQDASTPNVLPPTATDNKPKKSTNKTRKKAVKKVTTNVGSNVKTFGSKARR
ncbi:MAP kinase-activating death domain protein [Acrasis kona]|uniref:MAP kinase-activating death domain protein n=1 Tax=Acrasis kona TaxID=1008807 RepID=A0AAW2YJT6_9EUKA